MIFISLFINQFKIFYIHINIKINKYKFDYKIIMSNNINELTYIYKCKYPGINDYEIKKIINSEIPLSYDEEIILIPECITKLDDNTPLTHFHNNNNNEIQTNECLLKIKNISPFCISTILAILLLMILDWYMML